MGWILRLLHISIKLLFLSKLKISLSLIANNSFWVLIRGKYFFRRSKHGGKLYPCDLCDYQGSTSANTRYHKMSRHEGIFILGAVSMRGKYFLVIYAITKVQLLVIQLNTRCQNTKVMLCTWKVGWGLLRFIYTECL